MCDGIADCKNAEEETNCVIKCDPGQFLCPSHKNTTFGRTCVSQKHICDGLFDCPHGEDEESCPKPLKCSADSKCEQICIKTADNQDACTCHVGYTLSENSHK